MGGEWYYLHADGKYDTTAGSTYEVKDVTAVITTKNVSVYPGKTAKINVKYTNTTAQTTKVWASKQQQRLQQLTRTVLLRVLRLVRLKLL